MHTAWVNNTFLTHTCSHTCTVVWRTVAAVQEACCIYIYLYFRSVITHTHEYTRMHTCKKCCFAPTCLLSSSLGFKIFFSSSSLIPDMLSFSSLHFFPLIYALNIWNHLPSASISILTSYVWSFTADFLLHASKHGSPSHKSTLARVCVYMCVCKPFVTFHTEMLFWGWLWVYFQKCLLMPPLAGLLLHPAGSLKASHHSLQLCIYLSLSLCLFLCVFILSPLICPRLKARLHSRNLPAYIQLGTGSQHWSCPRGCLWSRLGRMHTHTHRHTYLHMLSLALSPRSDEVARVWLSSALF